MGSQLANPEVESPRIGSRALSIFAQALNAEILRAHSGRRLRSCELEDAIGWAPPSSLRVAVERLCEAGALVRYEQLDGSQAATELTVAGSELLPLADALEHWLTGSPGGPLTLGGHAAAGVIRVLTAGWDATILRTLAERPHELRELDGAIAHVSYQGLKRRLAKLRSTHLVSPTGVGRGATYAATEWLRRAAVPITVAGHWELRHGPSEVSPLPVEVEATFLLLLPLVELPAAATGSCTLAALVPGHSSMSSEPELAGVCLRFERGRINSCLPHPCPDADVWALGSLDQWFEAVVDGHHDALRFGGSKPHFPRRLVEAIDERLFGRYGSQDGVHKLDY